jgi:hypothetical protein
MGRYEIFAWEGPDGALFLSDDQRGRIWKIVWRPDGPRVMHQ